MEDNEKFYILLENLYALELEEDGYNENEEIFNDQMDLINTFRNAVMTIHRFTEIRLDYILTYHLSGKWYPDLENKAKEKLRKKMIIFNRMEFYNKVMAVEEAGFFDGTQSNQILRINNIRNWFSHPSAYGGKIEQYKNIKKITEDLENIMDIYNDLPWVPA